MPNLNHYVLASVVHSLRGYGFHVEEESAICGEFMRRLREFVSRFCRFYEDEIEAELSRPRCERSRDDLMSWAVDEIEKIIHTALNSYRDRTVDHEGLQLGRDRIRCEAALTYFAWLIDGVEKSKVERQSLMSIPPKSQKHINKRQSHRWTPYGVDVAFEAIRKALGLK